jgi:enoyl-CoA hydratase/carnithine racemase
VETQANDLACQAQVVPNVRIDDDGAVRHITLTRPAKRNALSHALRAELHDAIRDTAENADCHVVVLAGEGPSFSVGADLRDPDGQLPASWTARRRRAGAWGRLLDDLEALPQATIARLHGHVVGGAGLLAVACDFRVAAPDLKYSIPEVALGIPLTWAGLPRLVREIGLPRTRDLVMTGRTVVADEALAWGLVQRVDESADELVAQLARMPAGPLTMTKVALAAIGRTASGHELGWADADLLGWATVDPESRDAMRAYIEERLR